MNKKEKNPANSHEDCLTIPEFLRTAEHISPECTK